MTEQKPKQNRIVQYLKVGGMVYLVLLIPVVVAAVGTTIAESARNRPTAVGTPKADTGLTPISEVEANVGIPCRRMTKQILRDPDSFEQISITPYNSKDGVPMDGVVLNYRARNGFGGYGGGSVECVSMSGEMQDTRIVSHSEE